MSALGVTAVRIGAQRLERFFQHHEVLHILIAETLQVFARRPTRMFVRGLELGEQRLVKARPRSARTRAARRAVENTIGCVAPRRHPARLGHAPSPSRRRHAADRRRLTCSARARRGELDRSWGTACRPSRPPGTPCSRAARCPCRSGSSHVGRFLSASHASSFRAPSRARARDDELRSRAPAVPGRDVVSHGEPCAVELAAITRRAQSGPPGPPSMNPRPERPQVDLAPPASRARTRGGSRTRSGSGSVAGSTSAGSRFSICSNSSITKCRWPSS